MLLRQRVETCSLARRGEDVKPLERNCRPRPSGRSNGQAALALRVVGAVLIAQLSLACQVRPPPLERANLLADHGRETEAIDLLEGHLASHPGDVAERRQLIRLYGRVGRIDQASAQTERLAEILPRASPIPFVELGYALELSHRFEEALAAYDRASEVAPREPLGPKSGGLRAAHWGELEQAEPRLEEAVRRAPLDAESWHGLGLVRVGLGKLEAARQAYVNGVRADPNALENHLGLATVALRMNQPEQALAEYDTLVAARPRFTAALLGKSWCLIVLERFDAAESVLEQAAAHGAAADSVTRQRLAIRDRRARAVQKSRTAAPP
jgi:tetratricopeptide (TPR) repeat protein